MDREFIIQRYALGLWPQLRGERPFIASGPNFQRYVIPGSLERDREHRFVPAFVEAVRDGFTAVNDLRPEFAEFLLSEGIASALWMPGAPARADERWELSILGLVREIPGGDIPLWGIELLSGISSPEHYRNMLSLDGIELETATVPG